MKNIKDNDVKFVDLRFTDPRGKWQHLTMDVGVFDEDMIAEGIMFDGSSISGWKAINESDMTLMPDLEHRRDGSVHGAKYADPDLRYSGAVNRPGL